MKLRLLAALFLLASLCARAYAQTQSGDVKAISPPPPAPARPPAGMRLPDFGRLEGGVYSNGYFGLTFSVPKDWVVDDSAARNAMQEKGAELLAGSDERKKQLLEAAAARSYYLVSMLKYPRGSAAGFNAHFGFYVERVPTAVVRNGTDYLTQMLRTASISAVKLEPVGPISPARISGADFAGVTTKMTLPDGRTAMNKFYVTLSKNFALLFSYTYMDEDDLKTFEEIVRSVALK